MYYNNFLLSSDKFIIDNGGGGYYEYNLGELYTFGLTYNRKLFLKSNIELEIGLLLNEMNSPDWSLIDPIYVIGKFNLITFEF